MMVRAQPLSVIGLLLVGLGVALVLRLVVAGEAGARSVSAGVVFAAALLLLAAAAGWRPGRIQPGPIALGLLGAAGLIAIPAWLRLSAMLPLTGLPFTWFPLWAAVVSAVAVAEELLLRGALFTAINSSAGAAAALIITTVAFALLHVPLYGWTALPLDLAVGFWLGALRLISGSVTAPAIAHTLADLAVWWLL